MENEFIILFNNKKFNDIIILLKNDINKRINVNIKDENGNYLITYAVLFNNIELVNLLIKHNTRIDILDNDNRSLIYIAIKYGYYDIIDILLNDNNIGVNIIDVRDIQGYVALHYAIINKNIRIINMLLKYNAKINMQNNQGYSPLHLAVIYKNYDICKIITEYRNDNDKLNINIKCNTGETALHLAVNFELCDIVLLLLKSGINPNLLDYDNEYSPLHYCIFIDNINIIKYVIDFEADVNIQDIYGNTPLHYSIIENNYKSFTVLINNNNINCNLVNLSGNTPLHIALIDKLSFDYIDVLLPITNINLQNNNGDSVLHLLTKFDLWNKYCNILAKKKLNNNLKNNQNYLPIDYIKDKDKFIELLIDSYIYLLYKNPGNTWVNEFDNFCKNKNNLAECRNIIKKNILNCSYPKKNNMCFKIDIHQDIDFCTFTGSSLDIYIGMIFLLKKHDNASTIYIIKELLWTNNNIVLPNNFSVLFDKCLNNNKIFIIIPLGIILDIGSHSNYIIFDKRDMTFERFEPHGSSFPVGFNYNPDVLDKSLHQLFKKFNYVPPHKYLPRIGFQILDTLENDRKYIGDPGGFCALWSIWYTDYRLTYYNVNRNKLVKLIIKTMRSENIQFKKMIRNYSVNITSIRDNVLKNNNLNINDWINENYSSKQLNDIFDYLLQQIK